MSIKKIKHFNVYIASGGTVSVMSGLTRQRELLGVSRNPLPEFRDGFIVALTHDGIGRAARKLDEITRYEVEPVFEEED